MYGPANPLALLPATWASDYLQALQIAAVVNTLLWLAPVFLLVRFWPREELAVPTGTRALLAAACCLAMPPSLLVFFSADATCSAFSLLSLLCLAQGLNGGMSAAPA